MTTRKGRMKKASTPKKLGAMYAPELILILRILLVDLVLAADLDVLLRKPQAIFRFFWISSLLYP